MVLLRALNAPLVDLSGRARVGGHRLRVSALTVLPIFISHLFVILSLRLEVLYVSKPWILRLPLRGVSRFL